MKEIPIPTLGLSAVALPRGSLHPCSARPGAALELVRPVKETSALTVFWARHLDEVRQAQALRYQVFAQEMGATIRCELPEHDIDRFDDYCEHLIVRDDSTGQTVGTYRLLTPVQAHRAGGWYTQTEFDISALHSLRFDTVELGRSCVHADYRSGAVIMALWGALAQFMTRNKLRAMMGCASIPLLHQGQMCADVAASIWQQVSQTHLADPTWQVQAHTPLPIGQLRCDLAVEPPALIKGYLRLGAQVLGAPAWDPDFNTADLPLLMQIDQLPSRYRKHFLGA